MGRAARRVGKDARAAARGGRHALHTRVAEGGSSGANSGDSSGNSGASAQAVAHGRDTRHHARVSCPQAMSRRVELAVIAPTAAAAPEALVQSNDPLTAVAEKAQLKYNEAIDGLCKRVEEGAKEEGELVPIVPYDPDSDAPNMCLVVDEEQRPMPLHLCPTVLAELDLPRAAMGIARVLV